VKILKYPHPILMRPTAEVKNFDEALEAFARQMFTAMYDGRGVGLSANQVGKDLRMAVINFTGEPEDELVIINPVITRQSDRVVEEEGCLSFPEIRGRVARAGNVTLEYFNLSGDRLSVEVDGFLARVFQHELDHLDGVVFISKMTPAARARVAGGLKTLEKEFESEVNKTYPG